MKTLIGNIKKSTIEMLKSRGSKNSDSEAPSVMNNSDSKAPNTLEYSDSGNQSILVYVEKD
jgi:hypothetical protein